LLQIQTHVIILTHPPYLIKIEIKKDNKHPNIMLNPKISSVNDKSDAA